MKRKKFLVIGGVVLIISLVVGIFLFTRDSEEPVQVVEVKNQTIEQTILATGKAEAASEQKILARSNGIVKEVNVKPGDKVKAGQILLSLEASDLEKKLKQEEANLAIQKANFTKASSSAREEELNKAKANLKRAKEAYEIAKNKFDRTQILYNEGAVSETDLEAERLVMVNRETEYRSAQEDLSLLQAGESSETLKVLENQVKQAELAVQLAREDLENSKITSSQDGVVLLLETEPGNFVNAGTHLVTVGNPLDLEVEAEINEADSALLSIGQEVKITSPAIPDEEFDGEVSVIAPSAVTTSNSQGDETKVAIKIDIKDTNEKLRPGYTVDLEITAKRVENALAVPYEAVIHKEDKEQVMVVEKGKVKLKDVETGIGDELSIVITKGLKAGEQVIKNPGENLKEGVEVNTVVEGKPGEGEADKV